jgi:hypothetical protein
MLHAGEDLLVRGDLDAVKSSLSKQQNVVTTLKSQLVSPSVSTFVIFQKLMELNSPRLLFSRAQDTLNKKAKELGKSRPPPSRNGGFDSTHCQSVHFAHFQTARQSEGWLRTDTSVSPS